MAVLSDRQGAADCCAQLGRLVKHPGYDGAVHGLDDRGGVYVLSCGEHLGQDVDIGSASGAYDTVQVCKVGFPVLLDWGILYY